MSRFPIRSVILGILTFTLLPAAADVVPPPDAPPAEEQKQQEPPSAEPAQDEAETTDSDAQEQPADAEQPAADTAENDPEAQAENAAETKSTVDTESTEKAAEPAAVSALKPRVAVMIPSVKSLIEAWEGSHAQPFALRAAMIVQEIVARSEQGANGGFWWKSLGAVRHWSDTPIEMFTFAPDLDGKARIALRVGWTVDEFHEQLMEVRDSESAAEFFTGITSTPDSAGGYSFSLDGVELAHLSASSSGGSILATHPDLPLPPEPDWGSGGDDADTPKPLITLIYDFTKTEKDSGAGMFGGFSVLQRLLYQARVDDSGQWEEGVELSWPPLTGFGTAIALNKVKDTFFVPSDAFGAVALDSMALGGMVDQLSGFHMFNGAEPGAISRHVRSTLCVTALEGVGLIPIPDIVVQSRVGDTEAFAEGVRHAIKKQHEFFRKQEREESWHEEEIRGRTVFWNDGRDHRSNGLFQMRPVMFLNKEKDAAGRERDYMVMALTSTRPVGFVNRWLDAPRPADRRFVPDSRKTEGQGWFNWVRIYDSAAPYLNLFIGAAAPDSVLPKTEALEEHLTEGRITINMKWTGATIDHAGPVPVGLVAAPTLIGMSLQQDYSGSTDLARERFARNRLNLFYYHAKLFKKDIGRWPAELAELDGYIDFAGNPQLMRLQRSGVDPESSWFGFLAPGAEDADEFIDDEDEDEEEASPIDNKLFVIDWGEEKWTLGIKPGTLAHLERLYIDQDGEIHRVPKTESKDKKETDQNTTPKNTDSSTTASLFGTTAGENVLQTQ